MEVKLFGKNKTSKKTKKNKKRPAMRIMPVELTSDFAKAEAYRLLRTNIMFSTATDDCKKIVMTSSLPDEGKSTVVAHLAHSLTQMKERVLLIDCDMRAPTMHRMFRAKSMPGLSEVLAGMTEISEVLTPVGNAGLHIIPAGTIPPNPAELLASDRMSQILEELEADYDYILFDTPPVNVVSDALNLAKKVDGFIVVSREGETEHSDLRHCLDALEFANAKILGLVLNGSQVAKDSYNAYGYYGTSNQ